MNDLEVAFRLNDQLLTFWQFYIAWTAAVMGWVLSRNTTWPKLKAYSIGIGAVLFDIFNLSGVYKSISALETVLAHINKLNYKVEGVSPEVVEASVGRLVQGEAFIHVLVHIIADLIVLYFVLIYSQQDLKKASDH